MIDGNFGQSTIIDLRAGKVMSSYKTCDKKRITCYYLFGEVYYFSHIFWEKD